ncbi:histidine phosphotransferase family protein [Thalassovita sp.]|uniref:histidine phosphotransferase family protein n=1 Tax=Thalassovita sp. TaxID=1979401 RepID=UPI003B5A3FAA
MPNDSLDLSALIGSRVCHDLISPIGAIGNGLELLQMGHPQTPEMQLIAQSVQNATARVKFFRIAFGKASQDQQVNMGEAYSILRDLSEGGRITYELDSDIDPDRAGLQSAFLGALCLETALPYGGRISINHSLGMWEISCTGRRIALTDALMAQMTGKSTGDEVKPSEVQFLLFPASLVAQGRSAKVKRTETELALFF